MRLLFTCVLCLLLAAPVAQAQKAKGGPAPSFPVDPETHLVTYTAVVEAPGATKDQLYERALEWMAQTYQSANDAVQFKDKEQGKLVAKGYTVLKPATPSVGLSMLGASMPAPALLLEQSLSLYLKDGRYKYVLTDLTVKGPNPKDVVRYPLDANNVPYGFTKKTWAAAMTNADQQLQAMIASLNRTLQAKGKDPSDF